MRTAAEGDPMTLGGCLDALRQWGRLGGVDPAWDEQALLAALGPPAARSGRRKAGFWSLRFLRGEVTADVSLVAPGVIALIAVEGPITDGALEAALAGWSVAETGPTTRRLSAGDRVVDLEWHGGRASLAWQPASPAR